jgi:FAD synthetase
MRRVMVFGAFDGLHPGHLDFFKQAKRYGDFLIVSVGTDRNVKRIKGKRPLFSQNERLELVRKCRIVDQAVLGTETKFYVHIRDHEPDVICLGYDQWATEREVREGLDRVGLKKVKVVRLKPYQSKKAKCTIVKNKSVDY